MYGFNLFKKVPDTYRLTGYRLLTNFDKERLEIHKTAIQVYRIIFDTCHGLKIDKASNEYCDYGLWILKEHGTVDLSRYWDILKKIEVYDININKEESNNG